jgi:hypothetical protein
MASESSKPQLPYMSYGVFTSTNQALAESTVPTGPLDRHVLDKLSGADHGALMSGLYFLGFVDRDRKATAQYRELIRVSKEENRSQFQALLYETLSIKYADIIGDLNVETATLSELEKAFKAYGVPAGQMLTKTIRFYVKALGDCDVSVSPYILKPRPRTPRTTKKPSKGGTTTRAFAQISNDTAPKGYDRMPVPGLPQAFVQFPLDITTEQVDLFGAVVNVLRTFAKGKSGRGDDAA